MPDTFISSVHIQKLGHTIQEIRERALLSIISKLEHGFVYDNDLARSKEILSRLFEWFSFVPCTYQSQALSLIEHILISDCGETLLNHYGPQAMVAEMRQVRSNVEPRLYPTVDHLLTFLQKQRATAVHSEVPPLQSDLPLSYRTQETDRSAPLASTVGSTATAIEGFIQHASSSEQQTGLHQQQEADSLSSNKTVICNNLSLKWQPLIVPDRHVLISVEQTLKNPPDLSSLLHSCEFVMDIMLEDFPAEVFLQRPTIVLLFQGYIKSSSSTRLTNTILNCLLKLTKYLITRIYYYRDPSTFNSKHAVLTQEWSENSTTMPVLTSLNTEHSYIHSLKSPQSTCELDNEDIAHLKNSELTIPQYCFSTMLHLFDYICIKPDGFRNDKIKNKKNQSGVNFSLVLLDELISLLSLCLKTAAWDQKTNPVVAILYKFDEVLVKFAEILEHFRLEVMSNNFKTADRTTHLHLLYSCVNLFVRFIPLNKADILLPRPFKNALASVLLDSALARLYPNLHEIIFQFVKEFGGRFETDSIAKYNEVKLVCASFSAAIKLLRNSKSLSGSSAIKLANAGIECLEFHKNLTFVSLVVSICANKLPTYLRSDEVFEVAEDVVLKLLAHRDAEISEETYKLCHKRVISTIGPKLNVSGTGAPGSEILFLLQASIFVEICLYGITNKNKQIQKYADNILVHVLKCKILISEEIWNQIVQELIPTFPILTCFAEKTSILGRTVMNMLDPDSAVSLNIPTLEVLRGNLRFLFVNDKLARDEAVSRLCWMMGLQTNSRNLLPRLNSLQDKSLSVVCHLQRVFDINKLRPTQHFYQASTLYQVLELLNSENVEPVIRRSALTQVSVMLEDSLLHHTFIERDGVKIIISVMKNALTENDYKDYVDCIIPAVSILKNVCLYNSSVRQEISNDLDVHFYILRGLFIFCSEDRMRQDCSVLLFLLLFHNYILGSPAKIDLSVPFLIQEKLVLPFTCNTHSRTSQHTLPGLRASLLSDKWCLSSIQIHWNSEWFGGFSEILGWEEVKYTESHLNEFNAILHLTNNDLLALKNSSLDYCITTCLINIQNATSHNAVIDAINKLESYVNLLLLSKSEGQRDFFKYQWEYGFSRFISAPPANDEDMLLLISVLKFLVLLVPLYTFKGQPCWIISVLKDPSHCLPNLLQVESTPDLEMKLLHQEILKLVTVCVWHEQQHLDLHIPETNQVGATSWFHVIEIVAETLKFSDAQDFYNLAYLDSVLSCLVHLTTALGWSRSKPGNIPKEPIPGLILGLCELVGAFHCGKGHSAASSLMGLSITRCILLILNHLLAEMQYFGVKSWEMCFLGERVVEQSILFNLCALWFSRDVILRAAILQLLAGLSVSPRAAIELVQDIKDVKTGNGIWETALAIVLDHEEASIVRESAATLLGNLISHTTTTVSGHTRLIANLLPINAKKSDSIIYTILNLLEEFKFFKELEKILSCLYVKRSFYCQNSDGECNSGESPPSFELSSKGEYAFAYTKNITSELTQSSTRSTSPSSTPNMLVTPSFLKSIMNFIHNLLILAEDEVANALQEYSLIKMIFRSLTNPPAIIESTKDLSLYCDILQMNAVACALLSKAVGNNIMCLGTILHTRDCLNVMLSLLNPSLYHVTLPQLIHLRNKLWTEIFDLIGTLLDCDMEKHDSERSSNPIRPGEAITIVSSVLNECGEQPFLQTLCEAISSSCSLDLQQSALTSLTSLLRVDNATFSNDVPQSLYNLLDNVKTPRTPSVEDNLKENVGNIELEPVNTERERKPYKSTENILENAYFGSLSTGVNETIKKKTLLEKHKRTQFDMSETEPLMAGAELCRILLHLYDVSSIKNGNNKYRKKKSVIVNTLTSILCVSRVAKIYALENGLMNVIIAQLKELHIRLSLESVDRLRRIIDKKRVNPVLKELGGLVGLITNFMLGDERIKNAASKLGLSDILHKIWVWFCVDRLLLSDALKTLCTYTTDCYLACQSLPLTSCVAGSGPRKVPSNFSLLHEIIKLIFKEMELVSRTHDLTILQLSFHVLHNSCASVECRHILSKSNVLRCLSRLHPALTKKQKPWDIIELICLEFLLTFTGHLEGQVCVAKTTDALELIIMLAGGVKSLNRKTAMLVLRNIAFCQSNRPRLLNSGDFINLLQTKLANGSQEEKNIVTTIMWTLIVNNERAKLILKCAGLDATLQEALKHFILSVDEGLNSEEGQIMHHVLNMFKDGGERK